MKFEFSLNFSRRNSNLEKNEFNIPDVQIRYFLGRYDISILKTIYQYFRYIESSLIRTPCVQACRMCLGIDRCLAFCPFLGLHVQHADFLIFVLSGGVYLNLLNYCKAESWFHVLEIVLLWSFINQSIFICPIKQFKTCKWQCSRTGQWD